MWKVGDVEPVRVMGAEGYPYGFHVTTDDGKPLVSFAYASRALAEAAATHLESALLNAISVHPTQNVPRHPSGLSRQLMQVAFTLYMIVLFPGGAPVVTNVGTWQKASDCGTAADGAFVRKNTQGEQVPSISFVCVPRSGFGMRGMPIQP